MSDSKTAEPGMEQAQAALPTLVGDAGITAPSGLVVTFQEVVRDAPGPEGLTLRFRFIAPAIAPGAASVDFLTASADMLWLCQTYAVPRVSALGPQPAQIVISLADRDVPFGETAPEATQYFEAYSIVEGECIWDAF